jgi:3-polyprenyl-4-hydroxybenzoate decarboxylase
MTQLLHYKRIIIKVDWAYNLKYREMENAILTRISPTKKQDIIAGLRISKEDEISSGTPKDKKFYYDFMELLGEGAFCKVYKALYKPS